MQWCAVHGSVLWCSAGQCSAVKNNAVQGYLVQCIRCSDDQCSAFNCSAVQCGAIQCNAVQCGAMQCNAVLCSAVQYNAVQCNAVQCNAVQYCAVRRCAVLGALEYTHGRLWSNVTMWGLVMPVVNGNLDNEKFATYNFCIAQFNDQHTLQNHYICHKWLAYAVCDIVDSTLASVW